MEWKCSGSAVEAPVEAQWNLERNLGSKFRRHNLASCYARRNKTGKGLIPT